MHEPLAEVLRERELGLRVQARQALEIDDEQRAREVVRVGLEQRARRPAIGAEPWRYDVIAIARPPTGDPL